MKCPFIPGTCIGRDCPGWSLGKCFLEIFLQKMDNISLKLDTLCNITSIAVTASAQQKKPDPVKSSKVTRANIDAEPRTGTRLEDLLDADETDERPPAEARGLKLSVEEPARRSDTTKKPVTESESAPPDDDLFPDFPVKVSDFSFFSDAMEEFPSMKGGAPVRIEITELPMESPSAEQLNAGPREEVAINERLLLTGPSTNGSAIHAVPYDNIAPEFYEEPVLVPEPPREASDASSASVDSVDPAAEERALASVISTMSAASEAMKIMETIGTAHTETSAPEGGPETSSETLSETLSIEQVIEDITGGETRQMTPDTRPDTGGGAPGDVPTDATRAAAPAQEREVEKAPAEEPEIPVADAPMATVSPQVSPPIDSTAGPSRAADSARPSEPLTESVEQLDGRFPDAQFRYGRFPHGQASHEKPSQRPALHEEPLHVPQSIDASATSDASDASAERIVDEPTGAPVAATDNSAEQPRDKRDKQDTQDTQDEMIVEQPRSVEEQGPSVAVSSTPVPAAAASAPTVSVPPLTEPTVLVAAEEPSVPPPVAKEATSAQAPATNEAPARTSAPTSAEPPAFQEASPGERPVEESIEVSVEEMPGEGEGLSSSDPSAWRPIDVVEARGGAVLGIDFGSALSKVALKPDAGSPATAIPLGLTAYDILHRAGLMSRFESENEYVEDSLIYFDQNEFVFCGALAKKLSMEASETGEGRPAIQNLKTFLVRGGANLQIHSDFFPASESMDSQSVLAVYLAYLMRLTRHYLSKRATKIPTDLDSTLRTFAIPSWIEERYKEDVKRLFRGAAAYAFCLERWLQDDLVKGVRLPDLKAALDEARHYRMPLEDNLVGSIMTESVAGGNSRLIGLEHEKARPLTLLIVNVGAGFTDFALFSLSSPEKRGTQPAAQIAYKGGVGTGLSVWDNALKTLLFNKVKDVPAARRKTNEFRLLKARLELSVRDIKEGLLAGNEPLSVDVSPVLPEPVLIEKAELESSLPVKAALFGIRDGLRTYIKEAIKAVGMHRFDPAHTEILVTGGGAYMPSVIDCVREAVATLGPAYPAKVRTDYVSALYASIPNIAKLYPLLAVSLGVTEDELPDEQLAVPAAPATPNQNAKGPQQPKVAVNNAGTAPKGINKLRLA